MHDHATKTYAMLQHDEHSPQKKATLGRCGGVAVVLQLSPRAHPKWQRANTHPSQVSWTHASPRAHLLLPWLHSEGRCTATPPLPRAVTPPHAPPPAPPLTATLRSFTRALWQNAQTPTPRETEGSRVRKRISTGVRAVQLLAFAALFSHTCQMSFHAIYPVYKVIEKRR